MVEVVQDLFDHMTYAGGVGRRRCDAVRGIGAGTPRPGAADYAVVKCDPDEEAGPLSLRCMRDLMFHEMLDRPFEEKAYRMQLEEFAYRGERIVKQVDRKFGEVQRMVSSEVDVLRRSSLNLPRLLRAACDELRRAHRLVCDELEDVWHMRFEPFFYPADGGTPSFGEACPEGWLDLGDVFLTGRVLIRHIAELVSFVGTAVQQLPDEVLASRPLMRTNPTHPALHAVVSAFATRVPWIGAGLRSTDGDCRPTTGNEGAVLLNQAIGALDGVLTVHVKLLLSDLHRTMYQTFIRMCSAYVRWKRMFKVDRKRVVQVEVRERERKAAQEMRGRKVITPGVRMSVSQGPSSPTMMSAAERRRSRRSVLSLPEKAPRRTTAGSMDGFSSPASPDFTKTVSIQEAAEECEEDEGPEGSRAPSKNVPKARLDEMD